MMEKRRHPRQTVFKTALLYPVVEEANLSVENVSHAGLSGRCALSLGLHQQVHVSFDETSFRTAEVRWINGSRCGLLLEETLPWVPGEEPDMNIASQKYEPRGQRLTVNFSATLITSTPVLIGTIRNLSVEGMMVEVGGVSEGTRLLVKTRGLDVRMGRVQWASGGMIGIFFEPRRMATN
ncbi:PilZ domain-containing protein [Sphingobium sp. SJ10-10]|uniref:PilZ domain-containing protein n=1 Tax=Sphingobium sp. SJ10-10 TaxID=3114999 RepID=UPI002E18F9B0|nr:PilZ domain-containing protein [Sphingobium sp. SJ10-10]